MNKVFLISSIVSFLFALVQPVEQQSFEDLGGAYLTYAGKFGGKVSQRDLQKTTTLEISGCATGSKITKYTLVIYKDKDNIKIDGESGTLTKEMLESLRELKKGESFVFKNMRARLPSGGVVDVWCKEFTVV